MNDVEVDTDLYQTTEGTEVGKHIFDITKVDNKFNETFVKFYMNDKLPASATPYENLSGDDLRNRIYNLMFMQLALGNFSSTGVPTATSVSDFLKIN
jgi:hypothetical protein